MQWHIVAAPEGEGRIAAERRHEIVREVVRTCGTVPDISHVIRSVAAGWNEDRPWLAYAGQCVDFADAVWRVMLLAHEVNIERIEVAYGHCIAHPLRRLPGITWTALRRIGVLEGFMHQWVTFGGLHYDAAHAEGVSNPADLNLIRITLAIDVAEERGLLKRLCREHAWWKESARMMVEFDRMVRSRPAPGRPAASDQA